MMESLRIFGLLLHKNWLLRKRHWVMSLAGEVFLPVSLILCTRFLFGTVTDLSRNIIPMVNQSPEQLIDENLSEEAIEYAPKNEFIDRLVSLMIHCWNHENKALRRFKEDDEKNTYMDYVLNDTAIIFDELTNHSTKHLHYTIRVRLLNMESIIRNTLAMNKTFYYTFLDPSVKIQICLARSFIEIQTNSSTWNIPEISVQPEPYPEHGREIYFNDIIAKTAYDVFFIITFMVPLFIETCVATKEKFGGINVLMSMNGVSNILNILSWLISGILLLSIFSGMAALLMSTHLCTNALGLIENGNPLIVFVFFTVHVLHMMTRGMHVSAYFGEPVLMTFALVIVNALEIALCIFALEGVNNYLFLLCVGIVFPNILLFEEIQIMHSFGESGIPLQWENIYSSSTDRFGTSPAMIQILSIIGAIFHFLLTVYVYNINPGKYGIGKHPLFFLMYQNWKKKRIGHFTDDAVKNEYFESPSHTLHDIGIRVQNLKKSYSISLFNNKKVDALRGVSVDLYKGQITSLLGHNGAGKSTLISILTGMIHPTDGTVLINLKNLKENAFEILKDVGLCAQDDIYFPSLTVVEQLEFFAMLREKDTCRTKVKEKVRALVKKLKLMNVKDALPNALSADQRRKLCLGMAFVGEPSILILDEPTSRLDYGSKRVIWDLLLEMKSMKTILISTHDMVEADLMGDRVAIMHEGQLKSCGSPLFLKKMIAGQDNVEITLLVARWSFPESIRAVLHQDAVIVSEQERQLNIRVPVTSTLSISLKNLEMKKKDLGVTSYSLSLVSLEQVFLKMTQEECSAENPSKLKNSKEKLKGFALCKQSIRALQLKKTIYLLKESMTLMIQILTIIVAWIAVSIVLITFQFLAGVDALRKHINLLMYENPYTLFSSFDESIGKLYSAVCRVQGGKSIKISDSNIHTELMQRARANILEYNRNLIAAAEFHETATGFMANAFYSDRIPYSLLVSIDLVTNTIVKKFLGDDYAISSTIENVPESWIFEAKNMIQRKALWPAVLLNIPLYFIGALFAIHPNRETSRGFKQLQKITGVSGFAYWAIMFLIDMMQFTFLAVIFVICSAYIDYSLQLRLYETYDLMTLTLLLILYATNALPLAYIGSFMKMNTNTIVKLLTFVPIAIGLIQIILYISIRNEEIHKLLMLLPLTSFSYATTIFYATIIVNARCKRISNELYDEFCRSIDTAYENDYCCDLNCYNGKCKKLESYAIELGSNFSFQETIVYLCFMPLLYFSILFIIEGQFIQKFKAKYTKPDVTEFISNLELQSEESMIFDDIQAFNRNKANKNLTDNANDKVFLAYKLCKNYRKVKAVEDITFRVNNQECFGIFGLNRAGKSVTFKMLTGGEIPNHGTMFINGKHYKSDKKYFLSQMGYCPQKEAIIKCLNAYDHLRLFARLRGVPEDQVENVTQTWIDRLNLRSCAAFPTSTYSGGNKQRLSIAMALVGDPNVVLFDEPTERVDPGARRSFWSIIKSCQAAGQTFIIASHSMDECEALCDRMAIMVEGRLTCIGSPEVLKQRFGDGYDVQIRFNPRTLSSQLDQLKSSMRLLLPCTLTNEYSGSLMYYVSGPGTTWRRLYEVLNKLKCKYECIDDYIVIVRLST